MPICRTCRGEYDAVAPSRPPSGSSASGTAPATQPGPCPRCGSDLRAWDRLEITLPDFILWEGGILGLMPAALALGAWLFFWIPREASLYYYLECCILNHKAKPEVAQGSCLENKKSKTACTSLPFWSILCVWVISASINARAC